MLQFDTAQTQAYRQQVERTLHLAADACWHAGTFAEPTTPDRAPFIDQLAGMARDGSKRGTAHMQRQFEIEQIERREIGDYWIITTTRGVPTCVVRLTDVVVCPFVEVPESFAASEGEGDLSLAHWRAVHGRYFQRQCERWNITWRDDQPIVCESFEVVYPVS